MEKPILCVTSFEANDVIATSGSVGSHSWNESTLSMVCPEGHQSEKHFQFLEMLPISPTELRVLGNFYYPGFGVMNNINTMPNTFAEWPNIGHDDVEYYYYNGDKWYRCGSGQ